MINRLISLEKGKNYLLLGPRQVGKSTLVRSLLGPDDLFINLLPHGEFLKYAKDPQRFHQEVSFHSKNKGQTVCFVDEIQKIPELLNDVHDLIETTKMSFVMTGSSARKLRAKGVNLLAGRALSRYIFPLIFQEVRENFSLEKALLHGMLPKVWNDELTKPEELQDFLNAYAHTYLQEEIQQESLVRNVGIFPRFLDVAALNDGQLVNYSTIARDCQISSKTVQSYYSILEDTFLCHRIDGWNKSIRKQLTSHPKYYFFDCGITNALTLALKNSLNKEERGRRFEQFVVLQSIALNSYLNMGFQFFHWRDKNQTEVDLLLTKNMEIKIAVEFKSSPHITIQDAKPLMVFRKEHPEVACYVVGCEGNQRELTEGIQYMHWMKFLELIQAN